MDPIADIKPHKDSTLALMRALQARGAALFYMEQDDLYLDNGRSCASVRPVGVFESDEQWFALEDIAAGPLAGRLDAVLMRKDPPVDKRFIHACYVLERAVCEGVRVLNDPSALIMHNEKLFALEFPAFCPPQVIGSDKRVMRDFLDQHEKVIIKPLDAMGGEGVFLLARDDVNFDVVWEMLTKRGTYPAIIQKFIPEIKNGDVRVIVIDGEPFGHVLVRAPQEKSIRGNMAAGGHTNVRAINSREREIVQDVGRVLKEKGIVFAGLDVIGGFLTEINITSPTGLQEIVRGCGQDPAAALAERIMAMI